MVPLADRLRHMRAFRLLLVVVMGGLFAFSPEVFRIGALEFGAVTAGYVVVGLACEGLWRLFKNRGITLFGALLVIDGLYLAWACYVSGGITSPARYAMVLHLIAVALLASYRTGLKLALWDSLLTLVVFYARDVSMAVRIDGRLVPDSSYHRLIEFVVLFWLVALATATLSAVSERELRRRKYDVEALARLAQDLDDATGGREVAEVAVGRVADTFGFERVLVLGDSQGVRTLLAHRGAVGSSDEREHAPGQASVLERARTTKETVLVSGLIPDLDPWLSDLLPDSRNLVIAPLCADGHCVGVLVAEHAMRNGSRIERRVVSMLERFASHTALALRNASLVEQLQRMAATDGLTGVANRRSFDAALDKELARANRLSEPVSLLMVDIDSFKRLNDVHGHQVGDDVLRDIAAALSAACRTYETVARYGGEEFAVILPACPEQESLRLAERLREAVASASTEVPVTASVGVATFPDHAGHARALVNAADRALYVAKRSGRNRVSQADEFSALEGVSVGQG
jgi:diguanylate cyclase (GGDEF)-like protein